MGGEAVSHRNQDRRDVYESPTHKVDCFKGRVALELEWNNKDPFFDRDLNNFRLLFDLRAIDVGVIITRATELQVIFKQLGKGSSYGLRPPITKSSWPRIEGGGGGGCPVLTFAITPELYVDDGPPTPEQIAEIAVGAEKTKRFWRASFDPESNDRSKYRA